MKTKLCLIPILIMFLFGCAPAPTPATVINEVTRLATYEVTRMATVQVTQQVTVEVTRLVIVTATYSGPTETPAPTDTPSPTADLTKTDKMDGSYMVGSEISPGIWRSAGGSSDQECWIKLETLSGDVKDISGELPGATFRIPSGEYMVYIGGGSGNLCTWSFLKP